MLLHVVVLVATVGAIASGVVRVVVVVHFDATATPTMMVMMTTMF